MKYIFIIISILSFNIAKVFGNNDSTLIAPFTVPPLIIPPVEIPEINYLTNITPPYINENREVGTTQGSWSTTSTGAAVYTIPLFVSPGTAGVQPNLSLTYNSQNGNGQLGFGWNIEGISSITAVPKTFYNDGESTPVQLNDNDVYALDGNRLLKYSTEGSMSKYMLEINNENMYVVSYKSTSTSGPDWFRIWDVNGWEYEYGIGIDSKAYPIGASTPYMWRINKATDPNGNYITYHYLTHNRESVITRIEYTGNDDAGITPYNTVEFKYAIREDNFNVCGDKQSEYIAGYKVTHELLLREILIKSNGNLVRRYTLGYTFDRASHLTKITEYAGDGTYFNPIIMEWGDSNVRRDVQKPIPQILRAPRMVTGDFNGDGIGDVYVYINMYRHKYISIPGGGYNEVVDIPPYSRPHGGFSGDFFNTGIDDVISYELKYNKERGYFYEIRNNIADTILVKDTNSTIDIIAAELMGNGKKYQLTLIQERDTLKWGIDYATQYSNKKRIRSGIFTNMKYYRIVDFDGDGCEELMVSYKDNKAVFYKFLNNNMSEVYSMPIFSKTPDSTERIYTYYHFGDLNGDGFSDLLVRNYCSNFTGGITHKDFFSIYLFNGKEYIYQNEVKHNRNIFRDIYLIDLDGDGKVELVHAMPASTAIYRFNNNLNALYEHASFVKPLVGFGDFNGDGINDIFFGNEAFCMENNGKRHLVHSITNGLGQQTRFEYKTLTDSSVYTKGSGAQFPVRDFQQGLYVVSAVEVPNDVDGFNREEFLYSGAKLHVQGKGILGFTEITQLSHALSRKIKDTYEQSGDFHYLVPFKREIYDLTTETLLSSITLNNRFESNRIASAKSFRSYVDSSVLIDEENNKKIISSYIYDEESRKIKKSTINYYSPVNSTVPFYTKQEIEKGITTRYRNLRAPNSKEIIHTQNNTSESSETHWTYDSRGNILSTINYKNDPQMELNTTVVYSQTGVPLEIKQSNKQSQLRTETYKYDSMDRWITKITKTGGFVTQYDYDDEYGNVLAETNANGLTTQYEYNAWGALRKIIEPDGNWTTIRTGWSYSFFPYLENTLYSVRRQSSAGKEMYVLYNTNGKEIMTRVESDQRNMLYSHKSYDASGRISFETLPQNKENLSTAKYNYIQYTYDSLTHDILRKKEYVKFPDGTIVEGEVTDISYQYDRLNNTRIITDHISNVSKTEKYNVLGELVESTDPKGKLKYHYSAKRNITKIETIMGAIEYRYDVAGNRIYEKDPNAGETTYQYDGFNQLKKVIDANGTQTNYTYSPSGQLTSKIITSSSNETETYNYSYSNSGISNGLLTQITNNSSTTTYTYNQYGVSSITEQIDGKTFVKSYIRNKYGQITREYYPSIAGHTFYINYFYYGPGHGVVQITNHSNWTLCQTHGENEYGQTTGISLWGLPQIVFSYEDISQRLKRVKTGNISDWELSYERGLIKSKTDHTTQQKEIYEYDNALRLKKVTPVINGQTRQSKTFAYNNKGNMTYKNDLGFMNYGAEGKPNALADIAIENPLPENAEQAYHTNKCNITYTPFHKVKSIVNETGDTLEFTYGTRQQRIKTVLKSPGKPTLTKYFIDNYELETSTSRTRETHYIYGEHWVGAYVRDNNFASVAKDSTYFILTDHLGNFERIANNNGEIIQSQSFDVWGNRRNPLNWMNKDNTNNRIFTRGFSGHEHLDEFQLINMNGRVYDPVTAQFLSPDPLAEKFMNISPYSYCAFDPVNFTDPTGLLSQGVSTGGGNPLGSSIINDRYTVYVDGIPKHVGAIMYSATMQYYLMLYSFELAAFGNPILTLNGNGLSSRPNYGGSGGGGAGSGGAISGGNGTTNSSFGAGGFDGEWGYCLADDIAWMTSIQEVDIRPEFMMPPYPASGAAHSIGILDGVFMVLQDIFSDGLQALGINQRAADITAGGMIFAGSLVVGKPKFSAAKTGTSIAKTSVGRSGNIMSSVAKNSPVTINGTKFTGHALDQMQSRGIISPNSVLDIVKNPAQVFPGNTPGSTVFIRDNLKVVTNRAGDIITVMWQ